MYIYIFEFSCTFLSVLFGKGEVKLRVGGIKQDLMPGGQTTTPEKWLLPAGKVQMAKMVLRLPESDYTHREDVTSSFREDTAHEQEFELQRLACMIC